MGAKTCRHYVFGWANLRIKLCFVPESIQQPRDHESDPCDLDLEPNPSEDGGGNRGCFPVFKSMHLVVLSTSFGGLGARCLEPVMHLSCTLIGKKQLYFSVPSQGQGGEKSESHLV